MFKHLLVPLDGSRLAESALPYAAFLAEKLGATITLIHIIEKNAPKEIHSEHHLTDPDEARSYLNEVAQRFFPPDIPVESHVHTSLVSDVAKSIVEHVAEIQHDLVVMCTHGHSGLREWITGSIAQQVIGRGDIPVLLVRPDESEDQPAFACRKLLIPLDGNPDHEQGLPVAAELAHVCEAVLHLVMVIPTYGTLAGTQAAAAKLLPGTMSAMLDMSEKSGEDYLRRHLEHWIDSGITVTAEVARGDPAQTIINTALQAKADLIVLGTHGKAGTDAFWSGSVTPKISSRCRIPLLLVPVIEE